MDREEILRKSKKEMCKEEYKQVRNLGQELGTVVFACLAGFLIILDFSMGKSSNEVQGLFWAFFASVAYSKYHTYKRKTTLVALVSSVIAAIFFLSMHIMSLYNISL